MISGQDSPAGNVNIHCRLKKNSWLQLLMYLSDAVFLYIRLLYNIWCSLHQHRSLPGETNDNPADALFYQWELSKGRMFVFKIGGKHAVNTPHTVLYWSPMLNAEALRGYIATVTMGWKSLRYLTYHKNCTTRKISSLKLIFPQFQLTSEGETPNWLVASTLVEKRHSVVAKTIFGYHPNLMFHTVISMHESFAWTSVVYFLFAYLVHNTAAVVAMRLWVTNHSLQEENNSILWAHWSCQCHWIFYS